MRLEGTVVMNEKIKKERYKKIGIAVTSVFLFAVVLIFCDGGVSEEDKKYISQLKFTKCRCYNKGNYVYGVRMGTVSKCTATVYNPTDKSFVGTASGEQIGIKWIGSTASGKEILSESGWIKDYLLPKKYLSVTEEIYSEDDIKKSKSYKCSIDDTAVKK